MPTTNRTRWPLMILVWMVSFLVPNTAWGDVDKMVGALPGDSLAYWVMDPGAFRRKGDEVGKASPERVLVLGALRAAVASGIAGSKSQAQWVEGLLAAAMVGEVPHTLAVLDFRAHRDEGATKSEIDALQIVLELRTKARHDEYLRTMRAILIDAANAKGMAADARGKQRKLDLAGGRKGVAYRGESWPAWREVSWCSDGERFVIALGEGALSRWFEREDGEGESPAWARMARESRADGAAALAAFLDLDALRERFPEGFDEGRVERMVAALDLERSSGLMVRARMVASAVSPPLLAVDWITQDDSRGVRARAMTESEWPEGLSLPVDGATYVAVSRVRWDEVYGRAIRIHSATLKHRASEKFRAKHEAWHGAHGDELSALTDGLSEWLVLTDVPEPVLPVPGLGSVFVAADAGVRAEELDARLRVLLGGFMKQVVRTEDGVWSLKVDDAGLVRIPAWAFLDGKRHAMLAGGWGPPVVAHARNAMGTNDSE